MPNFESITNKETLDSFSFEKAELLALESTGLYVFHGSGEDLQELEPRQAYDDKFGADGLPAVFASSHCEYALFMAIVNKKNCPLGARSSAGATTNPGTTPILRFGMSQKSLAQLTDASYGFVHVFLKNDFLPRDDNGGVEYVSHKPIKPIKSIRVLKRDLPASFELIPER